LPWQVLQIGFWLLKINAYGFGGFLHYLSNFERKVTAAGFCLFLEEIEHGIVTKVMQN
jgi:hypothetical protein